MYDKKTRERIAVEAFLLHARMRPVTLPQYMDLLRSRHSVFVARLVEYGPFALFLGLALLVPTDALLRWPVLLDFCRWTVSLVPFLGDGMDVFEANSPLNYAGDYNYPYAAMLLRCIGFWFMLVYVPLQVAWGWSRRDSVVDGVLFGLIPRVSPVLVWLGAGPVLLVVIWGLFSDASDGWFTSQLAFSQRLFMGMAHAGGVFGIGVMIGAVILAPYVWREVEYWRRNPEGYRADRLAKLSHQRSP